MVYYNKDFCVICLTLPCRSICDDDAPLFECITLAVPILLGIGLCASLAQAAPGVKITAPKPMATLSGAVPVVAVTSGIPVFNYGTLSVDAIGKGLANTNPLRFMLDSTRLKNGPHNLQVSVSDDAGLLAVSPAVPVIIMNAALENSRAGGEQACPGDARDRTLCPGRAGRRDRSDGADAPRELPRRRSSLHRNSRNPVCRRPCPDPRCRHPAGACRSEPAAPSVALRIAALTAPALPSIMERPSFNAAAKEVTTVVTTILLDGQPLISDYAPIEDNGREMIFLRPLITAVGGSLGWNGEARQATATLDQHNVIFTVGSDIALVDGQQKTLDRKVFELHGRVAIPATAWRDLFAGDVGYDEEYRCVWLRSHESLVRAGLAK